MSYSLGNSKGYGLMQINNKIGGGVPKKESVPKLKNPPGKGRKVILHSLVFESEVVDGWNMRQRERVMFEWTDPEDMTDHLVEISGNAIRVRQQTRPFSHYSTEDLGFTSEGGRGKIIYKDKIVEKKIPVEKIVEKIVEVEKPRETPEIKNVVIWTYDSQGFVANEVILTWEDIGIEYPMGTVVVELRE